MKAPPFLSLFLLFASIRFACFGQNEIPGLLTEGQRAYTSGDVKKASEDFEMILAIDPSNKTAATYLRMIKATHPDGGGADASAEYAAVRLTKVDLHDATLDSTLTYLKQLLEKQTAGKTHINFVLQLPPDALERKVTLKLENVPFTEVLRYVSDLAGVTFTYEKYAVTVKSKGA